MSQAKASVDTARRTSPSLSIAAPEFMQPGLRPRLKGRKSLYDLVKKKNIDQLSLAPTQDLLDRLQLELASQIPLPLSPDKRSPPQSDYPINTHKAPELPQPEKPASIMPPVRPASAQTPKGPY